MQDSTKTKLDSIKEQMNNSPIKRTVTIILLASIASGIAIYAKNSYINAVVVMVLALAAAQLLELLVEHVIRRLAKKTISSLDDQLVANLHRPLFWSAILLGLVIAISMTEIPVGVEQVVKSTVMSILVFLWMLFALHISKVMLRSLSQRHTRAQLVSSNTLPLFTNLAAVIIVALGIYFIFQAWNIDMTAWLASAGIIGIAVGFAAKDTLANLFSGVFIIADSPYKLGDYVVIDNEVRGKITHMGIRSTRLLTRDDVEVTIPNSLMGNSKVVNESGGPHEKFRIRIRIGVAYGSDLDQVEQVLMDIAEAEEEVCERPEARVRYRAFGASSVDLELLCWVEEPELRGKVVHKLIRTIYKAFQNEGIEIPYSKQELFIKEMPAAMKQGLPEESNETPPEQ